MAQRGDTAATCGGALGGGGCHVGVPAPCGLYEAPPGFQSSDIEFPFLEYLSVELLSANESGWRCCRPPGQVMPELAHARSLPARPAACGAS